MTALPTLLRKRFKTDLHYALNAKTETIMRDIERMGGEWIRPRTRRQHAFLDRGASILAVAHLDSVQSIGPTAYIGPYDDIWEWDEHVSCQTLDKNGKAITVWKSTGKTNRRVTHIPNALKHPCLDDRLGAFIILSLLPHYGIDTDILFCDYEESGASTAQDFDTRKEYNWIVEFDRAGEDVVLYSYRDYTAESEWESALKDAGFDIGLGSYSDICYLNWMGCKAVNIGIGYEDYHSKRAYADLDVLERQLIRFRSFHSKHKDTHFEHAPYVYKKSYAYGTRYDDDTFTYASNRQEKYYTDEVGSWYNWWKGEDGLTYGTRYALSDAVDENDYDYQLCNTCERMYEGMTEFYRPGVSQCIDCTYNVRPAEERSAIERAYGQLPMGSLLAQVDDEGKEDYVCDHCGDNFEDHPSHQKRDIKVCPECEQWESGDWTLCEVCDEAEVFSRLWRAVPTAGKPFNICNECVKILKEEVQPDKMTLYSYLDYVNPQY